VPHFAEFVFVLAEVVMELGSKVAEEERFKLLDGKKMVDEPAGYAKAERDKNSWAGGWGG
jgi:hypothetical protein